MLSRSAPASSLCRNGTRAGRCPRIYSSRVAVPRRCVVSRAAAPDGDETAPVLLKDVQASWDKFMQRYEHSMLSSGVGAAAVTTWCVAHGQSPGTAAAITVVSTITALVLNEVLFSDHNRS